MSNLYEFIEFGGNTVAWVYRFSDYSCNFYDTHWHRDVELTYLFKGTCKTVINGQEHLLHAGELQAVNSGDTHSLHLHYSEPCDALVVILPYPLLKSICPNINNMRISLDERSEHYCRLIELFRQLIPLADAMKTDPLACLSINSIVYQILDILLRHCCLSYPIMSLAGDSAPAGDGLCKRILEYLEENYRQDVTLATASAACNVSREHIARVLRGNLGVTFKRYLTDLRLRDAHKALLDTQQSVMEISMNSGFPNCKSFIAAFKQKYSITPQKYRNAHYNAITPLEQNS